MERSAKYCRHRHCNHYVAVPTTPGATLSSAAHDGRRQQLVGDTIVLHSCYHQPTFLSSRTKMQAVTTGATFQATQSINDNRRPQDSPNKANNGKHVTPNHHNQKQAPTLDKKTDGNFAIKKRTNRTTQTRIIIRTIQPLVSDEFRASVDGTNCSILSQRDYRVIKASTATNLFIRLSHGRQVLLNILARPKKLS